MVCSIIIIRSPKQEGASNAQRPVFAKSDLVLLPNKHCVLLIRTLPAIVSSPDHTILAITREGLVT